MRRSLTAGLALATGTILLLDLLILNPSLELLAGGLVELLILLAHSNCWRGVWSNC